jgi:polysaccharide pyruvyl transferase WcaK-like protein
MKIINLYGYFGFKNVGDDLMLINFLNYLDSKSHKQLKIRIFCKENYYTFMKYNNIIVDVVKLNAVVNNIFMPYYIFTASKGLWIGGTCLYEPEDGELSGLVWLHKLVYKYKSLKKIFSFVNIGIGSIYNEKAKRLTLEILDSAYQISFREEMSLKKAQDWTNGRSFILGGDMFFLGSSALCGFHRISSKNYLGFAGHVQYQSDNSVINFYANTLNNLSGEFEKIVFISMHGSEDHKFHKKLAEKLQVDCSFIDSTDYVELYNNMRQLKFLIGMRLHSVVLADLLAIPNMGVAYGDKVSYYIEKSKQLVEQRTKQVCENIMGEVMNDILNNYQYNKNFILNEDIAAGVGIKSLFSQRDT